MAETCDTARAKLAKMEPGSDKDTLQAWYDAHCGAETNDDSGGHGPTPPPSPPGPPHDPDPIG